MSVEFTFYHSFENLFASIYVWLLIIILCFLATLPDILIRAYRDNFSILYTRAAPAKVVCQIEPCFT